MRTSLRSLFTAMALLLWFTGSECFAVANDEANSTPRISHLDGFPFVLITEGDPSQVDLVLSDSLFNSISYSLEFPVNRSKVDPNCEWMRKYREKLLPKLLEEKLHVVKLYVRGAASPEGSYDNNRRLGMNRAQNLLKILSESFSNDSITPNTIEAKVITEDYSYLVHLMAEANDPDAAAVRALMDSCRWDEPSCKVALQKMRGGRVWSRLHREYFPRLRAARIVLWMSREPISHVSPSVQQPLVAAPRSFVGRRDTIYLRDTVVISHTTTIIHDTTIFVGSRINENTIYWGSGNQGGGIVLSANDSIRRHPLLAIKTNLLFDLLTAVNASIEVPFGKRYSASLEVVWPWWVDSKNKWCMQMGNIGLEGRYYFRPWQRHSCYRDWYLNNNGPLQGGFVGLHADATYYDFGWDYSGHQGEAWSAGVTLGYQRRLGRHTHLEFSVGVGGAKHQYRKYDVSDDTNHEHLWRGESIKNQWYFGPTKAKISLVWLLYSRCGNKCQKGDVR